VKRDFDALEKRRLEAIRMWERGETQAVIARRVGVVRQSVYRWVNAYRRDGRVGVKKAGRAGRKPLLSTAEKRQLTKLLLKGPEQLGYETPLWTCPRVAHLIEQELGVRYHPGHVWKLLIALGWTPQRPTGRARERQEAEIMRWKRKVWPAIKKKPVPRAASSSSPTKAD
jgi:transposase